MVLLRMLVLVLVSSAGNCFAAERDIYLGMSAPLSGPAAELGLAYRTGAEVAFNQVNQQGGINGRKITLLSLDDQYEPLHTVENTKLLLSNPDLFALFGYIGTPTSNAILPLLRQHRLPYLAPFTGAQLLRKPEDNFIYHFRASYAQEAETQVRYFVDQLGLNKVGLLIQADEFGASVEEVFRQALARRQLKPLEVSRFRRNSTDITQAVTALQKADLQWVVLVGTYQPLAEIIQLSHNKQFSPYFSTVSFAGVYSLQALLKQFSKVYATMVVPDANQHTIPVVQAYQQALQQANIKQFNDVSLEGYLAATAVISALKQCQALKTKESTQDCLLTQLQQKQSAGEAHYPVYLVQLTRQALRPILSGGN